MRRSVYGMSVVWLCAAAVGYAAPQPAIVQAPSQWTAKVGVEPLRPITLRVGEQDHARRFWYTILRVENSMARDVDFYPQADLMTDTFELVPTGRAVPSDLCQIIKARHTGTYPLLEDLPFLGTKILQGRDHARDFAVIWPDFDPKAKAVTLFISGLSNETVVIDHPTARDQTGKPAKVFLRKTLQLDFALQGESDLRGDEDIRFITSRWVMR